MKLTSKNNCAIQFNKNGSIVSLTNNKNVEFCAKQATSLVTIQLLENRERRIWESKDAQVECFLEEGSVTFKFNGDGLAVTATVTEKGSRFEFGLKVENSTAASIDWIDYPGMLLVNRMADQGGSYKVLSLGQEGHEISDLTGKYHQLADYPNKGWDGTYPGPITMQFMAYYDGKDGLYFASHDTEHNYKYIDAYQRDGGIFFDMVMYPGLEDNSVCEYSYPVVIEFFSGNWADAAEIYRDFAESSGLINLPKLKDSKIAPKWVQESPIVVIYPVRGDEDIGAMAPNMYYPYTNALPYIEKLKEELGSRLLVLLCHWEGSAPWAPPYVWPPYGDKQNFLDYVAKLHDMGQLVGVYCSGTAWTEESIVDPSYNTRELFERENMAEIMACGIDQKLTRAYICNGNIRWGYDMCISQEKAKQIVLKEIDSIINEGNIDYIQYYDQNLGGNPSICYSESHGHPSTPGRWIYEEATDLFERSNELIKKSGKEGHVSIGCEAAAAEGYVEHMPFNDARNYSNFESHTPVPAYNYVYHEYVNNYMGNCNTSYFYLDISKHPEFLFYRTSYLFCGGDLLTVVLKQDGKFLWDWSSPWKLADVPENYGAFVKNLNNWRKRALKGALMYGRMLKPFVMKCGEYSFTKRNGAVRTFPSMNVSRWLTPEGEDVTVAVNYSDTVQTFSLKTDGDVKVVYDAEGTIEKSASCVNGYVEISIEPFAVLKIVK